MLSRVAVALWSIADTKPTTANGGGCVLAQRCERKSLANHDDDVGGVACSIYAFALGDTWFKSHAWRFALWNIADTRPPRPIVGGVRFGPAV